MHFFIGHPSIDNSDNGQEVELLDVLSPPSATPHPVSMAPVPRTGCAFTNWFSPNYKCAVYTHSISTA